MKRRSLSKASEFTGWREITDSRYRQIEPLLEDMFKRRLKKEFRDGLCVPIIFFILYKATSQNEEIKVNTLTEMLMFLGTLYFLGLVMFLFDYVRCKINLKYLKARKCKYKIVRFKASEKYGIYDALRGHGGYYLETDKESVTKKEDAVVEYRGDKDTIDLNHVMLVKVLCSTYVFGLDLRLEQFSNDNKYVLEPDYFNVEGYNLEWYEPEEYDFNDEEEDDGNDDEPIRW